MIQLMQIAGLLCAIWVAAMIGVARTEEGSLQLGLLGLWIAMILVFVWAVGRSLAYQIGVH